MQIVRLSMLAVLLSSLNATSSYALDRALPVEHTVYDNEALEKLIDEAPEPDTAVSPAQASPQVLLENPQNSLLLFGRGIRDRVSGQVLALACTTPTAVAGGDIDQCKSFRFVLLDTDQKAYWLGSEFKLNSGNNPSNPQKMIQKLAHQRTQAEIDRRDEIRKSRDSVLKGVSIREPGFTVRDGLGTLVFFGGVSALAFLTPISNLALVGVMVGGILIAKSGTGMGTLDFISPVLRGTVWVAESTVLLGAWGVADGVRGLSSNHAFAGKKLSSVTNQEGWNWSEAPKDLSPRKFERFKTLISEDAFLRIQNNPASLTTP